RLEARPPPLTDLALARKTARWRSVDPRIGTPRGIRRCSDIAFMFRDLIRETHLAPPSIRPHTQPDHMTAIDQTRSSCQALQTGVRPHMDSGLGPGGDPANDAVGAG